MTEAEKRKRDLEMYWDDDEDDEDTQANKFLIFRIHNDDYGIEIRYVTEIIGYQKYTEIPDMPEYIKGVINLRGNVIPIVDVRSRFRFDPIEYNDRTCIVIVNIENREVGLIVDTVSEIVEIMEDHIAPPPRFKAVSSKNRYVKGLGKVGEAVKILLDLNAMLNQEDIEVLDTVQTSEQVEETAAQT